MAAKTTAIVTQDNVQPIVDLVLDSLDSPHSIHGDWMPAEDRPDPMIVNGFSWHNKYARSSFTSRWTHPDQGKDPQL